MTDRRDSLKATAWLPLRIAMAVLATATTVVPAGGFLVVSLILNAYGCDESCGGGSWLYTRDSWVWRAQFWLIALPAAIASVAVVFFLARGRPRAAAITLAASFVLLVFWVLLPLTGGGHLEFALNFHRQSTWLRYAGLAVMAVGGSIAIAAELLEMKRSQSRRAPLAN
jgi:hypothetical protein